MRDCSGILGTIFAGVIAIILIILALTHLSWTLFFIIGFVIIVIASIVWLAWEIQK